jgi:hypothetical protein
MRGVLPLSLILGYFKTPFQLDSLYVIASTSTRIEDELERTWKEAVAAHFKVVYYPRYFLERLRKTRTLDRIVNLHAINRKWDFVNVKQECQTSHRDDR